MGDTCRACALGPAERAALDASLKAGEKLKHAAPRFGLSIAGLSRHVARHVSRDPSPSVAVVVPEVLAPEPGDTNDELLGKLRRLTGVVDDALEQAQKLKSVDLILKSVRTAAELLRLQADLVERLGARRLEEAIDLRLVAAFRQLRRAAAEALADHPEARARLAEVLTRGPA